MNSCQFNSDVALNLLCSCINSIRYALGHRRRFLSWLIKYFVIIIFYKDVVTNFHGYNAFFQAHIGERDARIYLRSTVQKIFIRFSTVM